MGKVNSLIIIGTFIYNNGDKYVGDWDQDKRSGNGNFVTKTRNHILQR